MLPDLFRVRGCRCADQRIEQLPPLVLPHCIHHAVKAAGDGFQDVLVLLLLIDADLCTDGDDALDLTAMAVWTCPEKVESTN